MLSDIDGNKLLTTKEGRIMQQVKLAFIYSEKFPKYVSVIEKYWNICQTNIRLGKAF